MYPQRREYLTKLLHRLEAAKELLPGSAEVIAADLPPATGEFPEDVGRLITAVYGGPGHPPIDPDDPGAPEAKPSPYLNPAAPSLSMPPVDAALHRLGLIRKDFLPEVSRRYVRLTTMASPGRIAAALVEKTYNDRSNWCEMVDRPELPSAERRSREVLEQLRHVFRPGVDMDDLARRWDDLGTLSRPDGVRRLAARLKDPNLAREVCRDGEVPKIPFDDPAFDPEPKVEAAREELAQSDRYHGTL